MAAPNDQEQFQQLLESLLSIENDVRTQAEVSFVILKVIFNILIYNFLTILKYLNVKK